MAPVEAPVELLLLLLLFEADNDEDDDDEDDEVDDDDDGPPPNIATRLLTIYWMPLSVSLSLPLFLFL